MVASSLIIIALVIPVSFDDDVLSEIARGELRELALGDLDAAARTYAGLLAREHLPEGTRPEVLFRLGRVHTTRGDFEAARATYERLAEEHPSHAEVARRALEQLAEQPGETASELDWFSGLRNDPQLQARVTALVVELSSAKGSQTIQRHLERMGALAFPILRHLARTSGDVKVRRNCALNLVLGGDLTFLDIALEDVVIVDAIGRWCESLGAEERRDFRTRLVAWEREHSTRLSRRSRVGLSELLRRIPGSGELTEAELFARVLDFGPAAPPAITTEWLARDRGPGSGRRLARLIATYADALSGQLHAIAEGRSGSPPNWFRPVLSDWARRSDAEKEELLELLPSDSLGLFLAVEDESGFLARRIAQLTNNPWVRRQAEQQLSGGRLGGQAEALALYLDSEVAPVVVEWGGALPSRMSVRGRPRRLDRRSGPPPARFSGLQWSTRFGDGIPAIAAAACTHPHARVRVWANHSLTLSVRALRQRRETEGLEALFETWCDSWQSEHFPGPERWITGRSSGRPSDEIFRVISGAFSEFWSIGRMDFRERLLSLVRDDVRRAVASGALPTEDLRAFEPSWTFAWSSGLRDAFDDGPTLTWQWLEAFDGELMDVVRPIAAPFVPLPGTQHWDADGARALEAVVRMILDDGVAASEREKHLRLLSAIFTSESGSGSNRPSARAVAPLLEPWRARVRPAVADTRLDPNHRFLALALVAGVQPELDPRSSSGRRNRTVINSSGEIEVDLPVDEAETLVPFLTEPPTEVSRHSVFYVSVLQVVLPRRALAALYETLASHRSPELRAAAASVAKTAQWIGEGPGSEPPIVPRPTHLEGVERVAWPLTVAERRRVVGRLLDDEHPRVRRIALQTAILLEDRETMLRALRELELRDIDTVELGLRIARKLEELENR